MKALDAYDETHQGPFPSAQLIRQKRQESEKKAQQPGRPALQDTRLANSETMTHHEPQVEASDMDQEALQDIGMLSQVGSAHPSRLIAMGEAALD